MPHHSSRAEPGYWPLGPKLNLFRYSYGLKNFFLDSVLNSIKDISRPKNIVRAHIGALELSEACWRRKR